MLDQMSLILAKLSPTCILLDHPVSLIKDINPLRNIFLFRQELRIQPLKLWIIWKKENLFGSKLLHRNNIVLTTVIYLTTVIFINYRVIFNE